MRSLFILPILSLLACSSPEPELQPKDQYSHTVQIVTDDGKVHYEIEINIPSFLDTTFTWVDHTDHHCGAKRKIRYQSAELEVEMETGFFHEPSPEHIQRLTIEHNEYSDCLESSDMTMREIIRYSRETELGDLGKYSTTYDSLFIDEIPFLKSSGEKFGIRTTTYSTLSPIFSFVIESNMENDSAFFQAVESTIENAQIRRIQH